jgi:hypothetical protein
MPFNTFLVLSHPKMFLVLDHQKNPLYLLAWAQVPCIEGGYGWMNSGRRWGRKKKIIMNEPPNKTSIWKSALYMMLRLWSLEKGISGKS